MDSSKIEPLLVPLDEGTSRSKSGSIAQDNNIAVDTTPPSAECCICQEPFADPIAAPCGHKFCGPPKACFTKLLAAAQPGSWPKCPVCREDIKYPGVEETQQRRFSTMYRSSSQVSRKQLFSYV